MDAVLRYFRIKCWEQFFLGLFRLWKEIANEFSIGLNFAEMVEASRIRDDFKVQMNRHSEKKGASRSQMVAAKFQASNSFVEPFCHIICRPHANRSGNKYIDVVLMGEFNRHSK